MVNINDSLLQINIFQCQTSEFGNSHSRMKEYVYHFIIFTVHHIVIYKL